jgi:dienelactone hydrolase
LICAIVLVADAGHAETPPAAMDAAVVGPPGSDARAELYMPAGAGPFPAMVVLHGCDGIGPHYRDWARELAGWGYVTILVDSFRPRGVTTVCNHGMTVPPATQAQDAFAAAQYLRGRPDISGDRIGVIGFSHGGWAVLHAVLGDGAAAVDGRPFAAAIAFYPGCEKPAAPLVTDTLILVGDADDWISLPNCKRWRDTVDRAGHAVEMQIYPGALHGFDAPLPPHQYAGHRVGRDPEAAAAATKETRTFLAARLVP